MSSGDVLLAWDSAVSSAELALATLKAVPSVRGKGQATDADCIKGRIKLAELQLENALARVRSLL